jgi:hypothetical protein
MVLNHFALPRIHYDLNSLTTWHLRSEGGFLELIQRRRALSVLSRTCKSLYALLTPYLYRCLLSPLKGRLFDEHILSIAKSQPALLANINQIEIGGQALPVLQHIPNLNGLQLDISGEVALEEEAVNTILQDLDNLQIVDIRGWSSIEHNKSIVLRALSRLPNLFVLSMSSFTLPSGFQPTAMFKVLQILHMSSCCPDIMQQILQAIAPYRLQELEILDPRRDEPSEMTFAEEIVAFPRLSKLSLSMCRHIIASGFAVYFKSLKTIEIYASYLNRKDMKDFLWSLPGTVTHLVMTRMGSLEIFKPLYIWLVGMGPRFTAISISIELVGEEHSSWVYDAESLWAEAIDYSSRSIALTTYHGASMEPHNLLDIIRRIQAAVQTHE